MTPLQFVTAECANHQPNGSCAGVMSLPRSCSATSWAATPIPRPCSGAKA